LPHHNIEKAIATPAYQHGYPRQHYPRSNKNQFDLRRFVRPGAYIVVTETVVARTSLEVNVISPAHNPATAAIRCLSVS